MTADTPGPKDHAPGTRNPGPQRDAKGRDQRQGDLFQQKDAKPGTPGGTAGGTSGPGSAATGNPALASGGQAPGQPVEPGPGDRVRGVQSQRAVPVVTPSDHAREAGLPGSAGGTAPQAGRDGSGSTTGEPGGATGRPEDAGTVGGLQGTGQGGPTPGAAPSADSRARGAGVPGSRETRAGKGQEAKDRQTARKGLSDGRE